jgi:hypothetical protein
VTKFVSARIYLRPLVRLSTRLGAVARTNNSSGATAVPTTTSVVRVAVAIVAHCRGWLLLGVRRDELHALCLLLCVFGGCVEQRHDVNATQRTHQRGARAQRMSALQIFRAPRQAPTMVLHG